MSGEVNAGSVQSLWQFTVDRSDWDEWYAKAQSALRVLQHFTGLVSVSLIRSVDEPTEVQILSTWETVGAYRRALSSTEAKMNIWPFLATVHDQPSVFETLLEANATTMTEFDSSVSSA